MVKIYFYNYHRAGSKIKIGLRYSLIGRISDLREDADDVGLKESRIVLMIKRTAEKLSSYSKESWLFSGMNALKQRCSAQPLKAGLAVTVSVTWVVAVLLLWSKAEISGFVWILYGMVFSMGAVVWLPFKKTSWVFKKWMAKELKF